jgi:hypothetical protein
MHRCPPLNAYDVTTAVLGSWQAQGLTAQQGDGLGFHFPYVPWCALGVRKVAFIRVAKHDVADFMEEGLHRESRNRADGDLPAALGVALGVAVQVLERNTLEIQSGKGSLFVPSRDYGGLVLRPLAQEARGAEPGLGAKKRGSQQPG